MQAIIIKENSNWKELQLEEIDIPEIKPNQVLVKIKAIGVNPIDWKAPEYNLFDFLKMKLPYIVGSDISGIVQEVGSEVKDYKTGDEVFGAFELVNQGAFAEYAVIDVNFITHKPRNLTFTEAAGMPLSSLTAWQGLFEILEIQPAQKVLIQAAAGGVGIFAVQLAKLKGAYVVAIGSEKNFSFLKELGADEVYNYHNGYTALSNDFDAVLDGMETAAHLIPHLKKGGRYLSITEPAAQELAHQYEVRAFNFLYHPDAAQLTQVKELIEENKLKVFIDKVLPLANASQILKYQMEGHSKGKNILLVT